MSPTKKIRDLEPDNSCRHREHNPPTMMVYPPGVYEHECPSCHSKRQFVIRRLSS